MQNHPKTILLILLFGILHMSNSLAQDISNRNGVALPFTILVTEDETLTIEDALASPTLFKSRELLENKTTPSRIYWIQVDFKDHLESLQKDSIWYLHHTNFDYTSIFFLQDNIISEVKRGAFDYQDSGESLLHSNGFAFNTSSLIQGRYLYIKVKRRIFIDTLPRWKISYRTALQNDLLVRYYSNDDVELLRPVYLFTGICLVMLILTLAFYFYSRKLEFLFYSLYVLFLVIYLSSDIYQLQEIFFGHVGLLSYSFVQASQIIINLFYILFIIYYLDSKAKYPKLHIALKIIVYVLLISMVLEIYFMLSSNFLGNIYLMNFERLIMTVFGLIGMIYLLIKTKDKLGYFIVVGSFFYMTGALALLFTQVRIYMILGSSLEIFIFACGLTYKIQQEYKAKLQFQKESLLFETKALRAQMNPHFIFNSLSSIQHLIISNKKEAAVKYLSKFSLLMRNLLESSINENVLLAEEIVLLEKYLELEALRFNNTFTYKILVEEPLDPAVVEVPSLIVQPFVENAILHGLLKKQDGDKQLAIRFRRNENIMICEIEDNGIGRKASEDLASELEKTKKSRGIEVTEKRLQMINQVDEITIEVIDKKDEKGHPAGTLVIIKIAI